MYFTGGRRAIPTCPRVALNARYPPSTDEKGKEVHWKNVDDDWKEFENELLDTNLQKIAVNRHDLDLNYELYGETADLCAGITNRQPNHVDGFDTIVHSMYSRDAM